VRPQDGGRRQASPQQETRRHVLTGRPGTSCQITWRKCLFPTLALFPRPHLFPYLHFSHTCTFPTPALFPRLQFFHLRSSSTFVPTFTSQLFGMEGDTEGDLNDSTIPTNDLLRGLLGRRKHYEKNCGHIAARRDSLYKEIPINHLVPLVFHTTPTLLENFEDIDAVVQAVSKQYKSDLFSDWQKYCKALDAQQRAVATFGMLILLLPIILISRRGRDIFCGKKDSRVEGARSLDLLESQSPAFVKAT
jgi:hypothetical protein